MIKVVAIIQHENNITSQRKLDLLAHVFLMVNYVVDFNTSKLLEYKDLKLGPSA